MNNKKRRKNTRKPKWDVWKYFERTDNEGIAKCKLCTRLLKSDRSYCLKLHLQKIHKAQSEAWKYFNYIDGFAICKHCQYRVVSLNNGHNLLLHLQIAHDIILPDFEIEIANSEKVLLSQQDNTIVNLSDESKDGNSSISNDGIVIANSIVAINDTETINEQANTQPQVIEIYQNTLDQNVPQITAVYHITDQVSEKPLAIEMNEKTLMSSIWGLMLEDDITPPMFAYKNMQSLLQPLCNAIRYQENNNFTLDEHKAEELVTRAAENVRINLTSNFDERLLSLKIDMDIQASTNTFCVTAIFIQNGVIEKHLLGIIDLKDEPQITEQHIQHILNIYNISAKQIVNISCDLSKSEYYKEVKNSDYLKEIEKLEYFPSIKFGDIKVERYIGVIGQLCLMDVFKNAEIWERFQECRNFCQYIIESDETVKTLKGSNLAIPEMDSPWKWGSTYKMLYDMLQARNKLTNLKYKANVVDYQDMWKFIDAFCKSLNHIQKSIVRFYSEEMHFGDFYAQWLKAKIMISKELSTSSKLKQPYVTLISDEILACFELRTMEILSKDHFKACLYLDPRFQSTLKSDDKQQASDYLKKLYSRFDVFTPEEYNDDSNDQPEEVKCIDEENEFLNEFLNPGDNQELYTKTIEIHNKIDSFRLPFKSADTNILEFWENLKERSTEMYELSTVCFAIPTTQIYNHYYHWHLYKPESFANLSTFTRDNLVTIRLNSNLVRDTLEEIEIENTQQDMEVE